MVSGLFLYGQGGQSDDDVVANFVARADTLDSLLRRLRAIEPDGLATHHLLIGVRGMGKTTLLRRLAIAIDQDPALAQRFTPLSFREEQYNVLSLGDFWRNCGEALAEWAERTGKDALAHRLDNALFTPDWAGDEEAADRFQAEMERVGRRAVLLVDNLDLILDALPDADQWILRRRLQARHGPVIVGASTRPLRQTADRDAAFYEFFQPLHLEALDERETEGCMRALAQRRGAAGGAVIRSLNTQPERLRTLHTLTGGNPRILTLIYRLLESSETDQTMADLEVLLDQVTPFYKARVEEYQTAQQRAVIDAIALHWDPITTNTLAQITNIPATTLSPLLIKLRKDGLIESRETSGSYAGHQLVERFLNIWYLMRHGTRRTKQKMRWLVGFLASFYSAHELTDLAHRARTLSGAKPLHPDYEFAVNEALEWCLARERDGNGRWADGPADHGADSAKDTDGPDVDDAPSREAQALYQEAYAFWKVGDFPNCLARLERLLERFGKATDPALRAQVVMAMVNKGITLHEMGDPAGAIAAYDAGIERFADDTEPAMREQVARAMVNKGYRLGAMGDPVGEIAAYDAVIERFADDTEPPMRERVARVMVNKGVTLGAMGDPVGEIAAYDAVIERFANNTEPALRERVARAMVNKGYRLGAMGDPAGAIAAYDAAIERFADDTEPPMREKVARAMVNKGVTLGAMGDTAGAIAAYDAVIERFADDTEPALHEQVARAMVNKGVTLGEMGDPAGEIAAYDAAIERFADDTEPAMREQVVMAMVNKGITLGAMGDPAGAIAAYDAVIERFADDTEPAMREQVARAMVNKGYRLGAMGDPVGEIAAYDALIERFADDTELALREKVARVMVNKGVTLSKMGDPAGTIATCDTVIERFADDKEPAMRQQVAMAMVNKGVTLGAMSDPAGAIAAYDAVIERFADDTEPALREQVARAMVNKGVTLGEMGDPAGAIAAYDAVIERFADDTEPAMREQVAMAMVNKGITLGEMGDPAGATAAYDALIERFADDKESAMRELVAKANGNLAWLRLLTGRTAEAEELRAGLEGTHPSGLALLDAGVAMARDNFGTAIDHLAAALDGGLEHESVNFPGDLERLLRLAEQVGYGERLLGWFEASGAADRVAPVYAALKAYVRGEAMLLDVNPEVGRPARVIYDRLDAPRRHQRAAAPPSKPKRPRGRPRKA